MSNFEYLMEEAHALYEYGWEFVMNLTLWDFFLLFLAGFALQYIVQPLLLYIKSHIKAFCKPTVFSYQHVVVTGGGTGLGKALV